MQSKRLNVTQVLMAARPGTDHWQTALELAGALAEHGVETALACMGSPSLAERASAMKVPGMNLRVGGAESLEWMLFLEMLVKPDIIQLFEPEHVLMPWRSPTVLHILDSALLHPSRSLFEASSVANLVVVEDEAEFDKLQAIVGAGPFVAVLRADEGCGWNYFLAYEEIVQGAKLDLGDPSAGRFELI